MNTTRRYVLNRLNEKLSTKKAENVEKSIYNFTIQYSNNHDIDKSWENIYFAHIYKLKSTQILQNLTPEQIQAIESKKVSTQKIAFDIDKSNQEEIETEVQDGIFQCRKCGSRKTTYYSLQTRSADEPMTNFITCLQCKNRWKM